MDDGANPYGHPFFFGISTSFQTLKDTCLDLFEAGREMILEQWRTLRSGARSFFFFQIFHGMCHLSNVFAWGKIGHIHFYSNSTI